MERKKKEKKVAEEKCEKLNQIILCVALTELFYLHPGKYLKQLSLASLPNVRPLKGKHFGPFK